MTSSRLRELSRAATPMPWEFHAPGHVDGWGASVCEMLGVNDAASPNAALIVSLRNDAEKYADLRDAVKAAVEQFDSVAGSPRDMDVGILSAHMDRLRAALAALGGEE